MDIKESIIDGGYSYIIKVHGYTTMMINIEHKLSNNKIEHYVNKAIDNGWK